MKPAEGRSTWQSLPRECYLVALLACLVSTGCRSQGDKIDANLMASTSPPARNFGVAESYVVSCPDVLDITFAQKPELSGPHPVGVDGRIEVQPFGRARVEGETVATIAEQLAELTALPGVEVRVAEYRAQCVYLFGSVNGVQRVVPYIGQETVLDLLKRTGGIKPGAAPDEVYVVRTHVGDNERPEVFHVNLPDIVLRHKERTNLRLEPFDQVHVGTTRRACLEKCVPPWLRPIYERICGWLPASDRDRFSPSEAPANP